MSIRQDRIAITNTIISAASLYKENMVGKTFLYVFEGQWIEVNYRSRDFLHLTGVATSLSAASFYRKAVNGTLRHNQIYFTQRHPYDLCQRKMAYIERLSAVTNTDLVILKEVTTDTASYQFGVTELAFLLCLDRDLDDDGIARSNYYIARSLRADDGFSRSADAYEVNYIFSKRNDEKLYQQISYSDGKWGIHDLPEAALAKLSPSLREP